MMNFPERQPYSPWSDLGTAVNQVGQAVDQFGQQQNVMQELVARRTAAALEQQRIAAEEKRKEWEFQQKKDDEDKKDAARQEINDLVTKGVKVPGVETVIPPTTQDIPGPWAADKLPPAAPYDVPQTSGLPTMPVTTPGRTETSPDTYRPATMTDYQAAILPTEDPAAFVKTLTPPNKATALSAARSFILNAKASGNKVIKSSDLDAAALSGDPTGAILTDKDYNNFKKTYATDAQAQTAETGTANAETKKSQLAINQQNADSNRLRALASQKLAAGNVLSDDDKNYWAEQWASGNVDPKTIASQLSKRGGNGLQVMADITKRAQEIDPTVNFNQDAGDARSAIAPKNKSLISTIDNVKSRMDRLAELSNQVDRTRFPTLNKWILSGERGTGDAAAELLSLNQDLMGEELSPVFGQGQAASDAKLKLAQDVSAIKELSPELAIQKLKELSGALDARKASITRQSGRYDRSGEPTRKPAIVPGHGTSKDPLGLGL